MGDFVSGTAPGERGHVREPFHHEELPAARTPVCITLPGVLTLLVAWSISAPSAKLWPASAARRKMRHHASTKLSQHAPLGMKAWTRRGWSTSHSWSALLVWLVKLSVTT